MDVPAPLRGAGRDRSGPGRRGRRGRRQAQGLAALVEPELHTVADDEAVAYVAGAVRGTEVRRYEGLRPGTAYEYDGLSFRTLDRPPGRRLATVATVNDTHLGEAECGRVGGHDVRPVLSSPPGRPPYPEVMNRAVAAEITALAPDLVVAKGDLTAADRPEEHRAFDACYRPALGERLLVTRGNHDHPSGGSSLDVAPVQVVDLDGVRVAVLDTSVAGEVGGRLDADQLDALDEAAASAPGPLLAFGHHPPASDDPEDRWLGDGGGLDRPSTDALVALAGRRPRFAGYWAGHTHRNRVARRPEVPAVPWAEVAATKDFPGSWGEYRVHEGGIVAVHRRASSAEALAWSEACRALVFGLYPAYALGRLEDRSYVTTFRP